MKVIYQKGKRDFILCQYFVGMSASILQLAGSSKIMGE